jgi:Animal haem peroxidase
MNDQPYTKKHGFLGRAFDGLLVAIFRRVNRSVEWHRLPKWIGVANLLALRVELRKHNLHDTDGDLTKPKPGCPFETRPDATRIRTEGGTLNDLQYPAMGCRRSRFGRNVARALTAPDLEKLMKPNPLQVSKELLARDKFIPARSLNLLAAAWIQFQVHDWFEHENEELDSGKEHRVRRDGDWVDPVMVLPRTKPDPDQFTGLDGTYPAYRNKNPQWWDGSQVYGETECETRSLRTNPTTRQLCPSGRLYIDDKGLLPIDPHTKRTLTGFTDNWWLGLEVLHTLFAKEHNAICDRLKASEARLSDDEIFEKARLINCAIMAKIHTVEWTPGILAHPAIKPALDANWMGLLGHWFGEGLARKMAGFFPNDVLTGVPLSETDHHGAPYALTEEFTAVYRLHPLIPDEVKIKNHQGGTAQKSYAMNEIAFAGARRPLGDGASMEDVIYAFGTANPGAITIKNYPNFLRRLRLPKDDRTGIEQVLDLAAVDILRDRERGVPRYNEFRRQLRKKPVETWEELAGGNDTLAGKLKAIYGNLEEVDTMVGMFCEPLPEGFGFSDTAFRIFILMASRRLKSDRFFTTDYREECYTKAGLEWIRHTGLKEVILRHHPALAPAFNGVANPFAPWPSAA